MRETAVKEWTTTQLGQAPETWAPASSDASFRRYFRAEIGDRSWVVMDAPPDKEDVRPFAKLARELLAIGVHAPEILAEDADLGVLLLSDMGSTQYLSVLTPDRVDALYADAMDALLAMQTRGPGASILPPYDRELLDREMALFPDWLLNKHLELEFDAATKDMLASTFRRLADEALSQPRAFVHRDYHSRNLMWVPGRNPGVLDFQDAVYGPVTYDLVSLLRDCYVQWPRERVERWALQHASRLNAEGLLNGVSDSQFLRWFDWMGVQRHLKASGIFARLYHRDGKAGYLKDVPRTLNYLVDVCVGYPELRALGEWTQEHVLPKLDRYLPDAAR